MARPTKQGIDYFPLDCSPDAKLELFIAEAGIDSFGILIFIWSMIYRENGYWMPYSKDIVLLLRKHTLSDPEKIETAIQKSVDRNIFDKKTFEKYKILTSSGIQKRFFQIAKKKKEVIAYKDIILIDVSGIENVVLVDGNPINYSEKPLKKSKRKEKEKEKEKLRFFLLSKINDFDLSDHTEKILEFFDYRMSKPASKQYKTEKAISLLLGHCQQCKSEIGDLDQCLDHTMGRDWQTPDPEYLKGKIKTDKTIGGPF